MKRGSRTLGTIVVLLAGLASMSIEVVSTSATSAGASSDKRDDDGGASNSALESQLRTDTSGQATFGIREATGDVTYIGGSAAHPLQAKTRGGQDDAARQFVDAYASLFGVTDTKTNLLQTQSFVGSDGTGGAVKFQQTYNGIPVIAGVLAIQVAASGAVLSATGEASSDLSIDTTPAISVEQAVTSSVAGVARRAAVDPTTLSADAPVLSIYDPTLLGAPDTLGPRLVWQLNVTDGGLGTVDYYVLIDAQQGTVALQFDQHEAVLNRSVCDNANNRALSETCTAPVVRSEGQGPTGATDVDNAYDLSGITYGFYMSHFGRDSVDGAGLPLKSTVRFCYPASTGLACPYANAFWDGSQMVYGDGFANADDVVGHELTHGVTQYTSGLFYYGASGAINESMSDVMGEYIDQTNVTAADTPATKWKLGEDLIIGAIRDMKNPPTYGDPDKVTSAAYLDSYSDQHGVHTNSGVNNKADYLITDGDTFNGQTITGLGIDKAARIYYQVETTLLTPGSDYLDLYNALPQACTNLIGVAAAVGGGITSTDCQQVTKAVTATEMNLRPTVVGRYGAVADCATGVKTLTSFSDDMETTTGNWVASHTGNGASWAYATGSASSGIRSLNVVDNTGPLGTSTVTMSNPIAVTSGQSYLQFLQSYNTDSTSASNLYDGGVVEYTVDNGANWKDINASPALPAVHGYAGVINTEAGPPGNIAPSPLSGRSAFGGNSGGYETVRLDTTGLAGLTVKFRFVFAIDGYVDYSYEGWFIDDVSVYQCGTVPGAPTAVTATAHDDSASLTWATPVSNGGASITGYTITPFIGATAQPATTVGAVTSATVLGLPPGSTYTFQVAAINAAGTGAQSAASNGVVPTYAVNVPYAPAITSAAPQNAAVSLAWSVPSNNGGSSITGYTIVPFIGSTAQVPVDVGNVTSTSVSGLVNGTAYTFKVAAKSSNGVGDFSSASSSVTPRTVAGAPTSVSASAQNAAATVNWSVPASDGGSALTGFTITPFVGATAQTATTVSGGSVTSSVVTGLTNGTAYTFKVTALNAAGPGALSSASTAVTPLAVPGTPTSVAASPSNGVATVSWVAPASNGGSPVASYTVTPFTSGVARPSVTVGSGVTTTAVSGLTNGTAYTFKVSAVNAAGSGVQSASSNSVTPLTTPGAPTSLTATAGSGSGQALVAWTAPSSNGGSAITGYTVTPFIGAVAQAPTAVGAVPSYLMSGLVPGSSYTFTVTAGNAAGAGPPSGPSNSVAVVGVAGAPTGVTGTAGDASATLTWIAPASDGGSAITGYSIVPFVGGVAQPAIPVGNVTSFAIAGLGNGTIYTFTVAAVNAFGAGPASAASVALTPTRVVQAAVSLVPGRLLDSRADGATADGLFAGIGVRPAGSVTPLTVLGRGGVSADAAAVVLNVTVTGPAAAGFVTVYPCGSEPPTASNLNYVAGQTIPNLVVTKVGTAGQVCLFTQQDTDLIADVSGYFPPGSALTPIIPARLLETRSGLLTVDGVGNAVGRVAANSVTAVQVTGRANIPADASAAVLNVTVTGPANDGYVTVYPCGGTPPTASNLNYVAGQTIANAAITKIGAGGQVCIFSQSAADLIVDVNGDFAAGASLSPLVPARVLDSRGDGTTIDGQSQAIGTRPAGSVTEVVVAGRGGVPNNATAVVLNVTVTEPAASGFVTVYPCGGTPPTASNLNYGPGLTIANAVITKIGDGGKVCIFTQQDTHLVADVNAYFAG